MPDSSKHITTRQDEPDTAARRTDGSGSPRPLPIGASRANTFSLLFMGALGFFSLALLVTLALYLFNSDIAPADAETAPISILPAAPEGVTVLARQPESGDAPAAPRPLAAEAAARPSGYAVDLGSALSFAELSARFASISSQNAEAGFDALEPRATLRDTDNGLEARLLVGPFETLGAAGEVCSHIALPAGIDCRAVPFDGELIARE